MSIPAVTLEQVQAIFTVPDGIDPDAFISQGNIIFNGWANYLTGYTSQYIDTMQTYFVVHLIQTFEPQSISYAGMRISEKGIERFLGETPYGRQVLIMDTNGYFRGMGKGKPRMFSL